MEIELATLWLALMLVYLLNMVIKMSAGDFVPGEIGGKKASSSAWLGIAVIGVVPALMIVLNILAASEVMIYANMVAAFVIFISTIFGIQKGKAAYGVLLTIIRLAILILIGVYACLPLLSF